MTVSGRHPGIDWSFIIQLVILNLQLNSDSDSDSGNSKISAAKLCKNVIAEGINLF